MQSCHNPMATRAEIVCLVTEGEQIIVCPQPSQQMRANPFCRFAQLIRMEFYNLGPGGEYAGAVDKSLDAFKRLQLLGGVPRGKDQPGLLG